MNLNFKYLSLCILSFLNIFPLYTFAINESCISTDSKDLGYHISNQIDSRINISNENSGLNIYSNRVNQDNSNWNRNNSSWTQKIIPLDFTGIIASNSDLSHHANNPYQGGGALITPRHIVTANHFKIENDSRINFFDKNGNPIIRKIVNSYTIPNTDINIGLLDSDVNSSINYFPLIRLSSLRKAFLRPSNYIYSDVPIVVFNQNSQALIRSMNITPTSDSSEFGHLLYEYGIRSKFSSELINGDSGQPGFMIINNQPVLLFTNHTTSFGDNLGNYIDEINSAIATLGNSNTYKVTEYSLTEFNSYSSFCSNSLIPKPATLSLIKEIPCIDDPKKAQNKLTWALPNDLSLSSGYRFSLYIDNETFPYYFPINQREYIHSNIEPGSIHKYKLFLNRYDNTSSPIEIEANTVSICAIKDINTVKPINNPLNIATTSPISIPQNPIIKTDNQITIVNKPIVANNNVIIKDTEFPTVTLIKPSNGDVLYGSSIVLSADARDNVNIDKVQFIIDGVYWGNPIINKPYNIYIDTNNLKNGDHTISAFAIDKSGNAKISNKVNIIINNPNILINKDIPKNIENTVNIEIAPNNNIKLITKNPDNPNTVQKIKDNKTNIENIIIDKKVEKLNYNNVQPSGKKYEAIIEDEITIDNTIKEDNTNNIKENIDNIKIVIYKRIDYIITRVYSGILKLFNTFI